MADQQAGLSCTDQHHKAGEWMLSYRFMHMQMAGNRQGDQDVANSEVLENFIVTLTRMDMNMHMFGGMYAVNDALTIMVMLPYIELSMIHPGRMGSRFTTTSAGPGDVSFSGLLAIHSSEQHRLHVNIGFSAPTGAIDERDNTPPGNVILPYPMQTGAGSYSLLPGITYKRPARRWVVGRPTHRHGEAG